jgi:hypothetical protein
MSDDAQDIGKWVQELAARSIKEQMHALQRYQELIQRVARGELDEQKLREEYLRFASEESARYARNLASLSLNYYGALIDLGRNYNDRLFDQILGNGSEGDLASRRRATAPRRVEMELHAPLGLDATGAFVIENKRGEPAEISFIISEFSGGPETATFRPPLRIQPPHFSIGPLEERVVTLGLPMHEEFFTPGRRYQATVIVRGYDDLELGLTVWADPVTVAVEPMTRPQVAEPADSKPPRKASTNSQPAPRKSATVGSNRITTARAGNEKPEKTDQTKPAKRPHRRNATGRKRPTG